MLLRCFVGLALVLCAQYAHAQSAEGQWQYLGPNGANVLDITSWKDTLYAATPGNGVFRSTDGFRWQRMNGVWANFYQGLAVGATAGNVIVAFPFGSIRCYEDVRTGRRFFQSQDGGKTWKENWIYSSTTTQQIVNRSIPEVNSEAARIIQQQQPFVPRALTFDSPTAVYALSRDSLYFSSNAGVSWKVLGTAPKTGQINGLARAFGEFYAASEQGVFRSADMGKSWQLVNMGLSNRSVERLLVNDSLGVAILNDGSFHIVRNGVLESFAIPGAVGQSKVVGITPTFVYAQADSVIRRSRNGSDWQSMGKSALTMNALVIGKNEAELFAATTDGIYRSQDSAISWQSIGLKGIPTQLLAIAHGNIYTVNGNAFYPLIKTDTLWTRYEGVSYLENLENLIEYQGDVYAEGYLRSECEFGLAKVTSSSGKIHLSFQTTTAAAMATRGTEIFRGYAKSGYLQRSTDGGKTWQSLNTEGLATQDIRSLGANKKQIFVGTSGGLFVLKNTSTGISSGLIDKSGEISFQISPNPASHLVSISGAIKEPSLLTISLFNLVGQEIVRLSAEWTRGEFSREMNVSNLSQGSYFLRLQTPTFSQTKPIQVFR